MKRSFLPKATACAAAFTLFLAACGDDDDETTTGDDTPSEVSDASVSFGGISDGDEVSSPVSFDMVAEGITIEPSGEVNEGAGHFHVMVDVGCVEVGEVIPGDTEGYNHFGKAQTEAELELEPGEHTLCLQVGDGEHVALDVTSEITITVVEGDGGDASVSFGGISDGDEVSSPVSFDMVAEGITIEPSGEVNEGAGHFHVMVDVGCVEVGEVIPGDTEGYNHFGGGQTEAELELEPGEHTLCLQVGDGEHVALDLTSEITITVVE